MHPWGSVSQVTQALLLMDIQNTLVERFAADGEDVFLDRMVATQERAEHAGLLIVLVRAAFRPGYPEISPRNKAQSQFKKAGVASDGSRHDSYLVIDEPATQIHSRLVRGNGEVIVTKKRVSAFGGSDLEVILRANDVTDLVLGGIATGGVVLSTVREAADRDYRITVLEDLCLDSDEEVHRVLTGKVFPRQAEVMPAAEWSVT
jgi:nicotinamidase-related amidase